MFTLINKEFRQQKKLLVFLYTAEWNYLLLGLPFSETAQNLNCLNSSFSRMIVLYWFTTIRAYEYRKTKKILLPIINIVITIFCKQFGVSANKGLRYKKLVICTKFVLTYWSVFIVWSRVVVLTLFLPFTLWLSLD